MSSSRHALFLEVARPQRRVVIAVHVRLNRSARRARPPGGPGSVRRARLCGLRGQTSLQATRELVVITTYGHSQCQSSHQCVGGLWRIRYLVKGCSCNVPHSVLSYVSTLIITNNRLVFAHSLDTAIFSAIAPSVASRSSYSPPTPHSPTFSESLLTSILSVSIQSGPRADAHALLSEPHFPEKVSHRLQRTRRTECPHTRTLQRCIYAHTATGPCSASLVSNFKTVVHRGQLKTTHIDNLDYLHKLTRNPREKIPRCREPDRKINLSCETKYETKLTKVKIKISFFTLHWAARVDDLAVQPCIAMLPFLYETRMQCSHGAIALPYEFHSMPKKSYYFGC
ncbi:hypothetical protein EVAR_60992_1 [Eumeta japonica]|uniref:Uncharacterized protein n=1 Tax=Eumeta variegata TaxID=151549 RepID=A0A4C1ZQQ9_EUMVA|nr:hypothetical protein EVAR_60992_1 [Eumeta japonica]